MIKHQCPCARKDGDTRLKYEVCCLPLHSGKVIAETPEQLMRSRYSAYFLGLGQYIYDTHHVEYRGDTTVEEFTASANRTRWCDLKVLSHSQHGAEGCVEFKASFIDKDKVQTLHEISSFIKENGRWFYTTGEFQPKTIKKINRNQMCPCGSGIKAKRCCLK